MSSSGVGTTVAGTPFAMTNGTGSGAQFGGPIALTIDPGGTLFVSDHAGTAIDRLDLLLPLPGGRYDSDGRDPTVFRASTGTWYQLRSTTGAGFGVLWGAAGDVPIVGDYDGDGKADPSVFRPSTGTWYQLRSLTGTGFGMVWGTAGDVPM